MLLLPALATARVAHQSRARVNSTAKLAELITDANPGTDYESVIYPATDETSTNSYVEGLVVAKDQFTAYAQSCEDSKIIFLAYSQGAMVVGDMLGFSMPEMGCFPLIRKLGTSFDVGSNNATGVSNAGRATAQISNCFTQISVIENQHASKIAGYCNVEDPVCASGTQLTTHLVYPQNWDITAAV
ncbi:hypothetical protein EAE96_001302 [Botrytis aclada]|nr:hypothetical protein EAE96_001302 [Botrytis aclada]